MFGVAKDTTAPTCALTALGVNAQQQTYLQITAQDSDGGLQSVEVSALDNATADVGSYQTAIGTAPMTVTVSPISTAPIVITATKQIQSQGALIGVQLTDVAGNAVDCDPAFVSVDRTTGKPVPTTVTNVAQSESQVTITNDASAGLTNLSVDVNGRHFEVAGLKNGEVRTFDIASALRRGATNTVTLTPKGKPGTGAIVLISN